MLETELKTTLVDRVILEVDSGIPGPTLLVIGGIHGNEPSGVEALERISAAFDQEMIQLNQGKILALRGNRRALTEDVRFIKRDLNRLWKWDFQHQCPIDPTSEDPDDEYDEYCDLQYRIHRAIEEREGPICFLDLHTTSAVSPPFIMVGDTLRNRDLVDGIPVPIVLGVEEQLDGPLLSYINELGHLSVGFEAGQHQAEESVDAHEALVKVILYRLGMISEEQVDIVDVALDQLAELGGHMSSFFEVRHRHGITPEDEFVMKPGYANFQKVERGQILAKDKDGMIQMPEGGRVFMPLYQKQGNDGFFQIRRIKRFWLGLSRILRRIGVYKVLPVLPGIRRAEKNPLLLTINTRIAGIYPREIFHLLGYRKIRRNEGTLTMQKRPFDFEEPPLPDRS